MKRFAIHVFSISALCSALMFTPAFADGVVNAVSYQPLPASPLIAVEPLDDSADSKAMQVDFVQALKAKGFTITGVDDATLVFTFATSNIMGAWSKGDRRTILEIDRSGGKSDEDDVDNKVMLNIYNSSRGALVNKGSGDSKSATHPAKYRIDVTLDDRKAKQRIWQAWATADVERGDSYTLTKSMIPVLSGIIGQTVRRQGFSVP
ncbi:MAG: hypothetical protein OQJ99_09905 [Rhodospirillales bacterium]|nr:hypothetical protein [Rhodospirillales bacterium]MCW8860851.1 hypothetical protein [Rhodospirillales bacterium]MCW8952286.1 hypothetical protein [Rhodospirillales bacterium]MCW8970603.1 hypothetical protein [Rhodospirillales bacterium]MCW9001462.1 hypothetical protein [Rhodospirillales bacterium]